MSIPFRPVIHKEPRYRETVTMNEKILIKMAFTRENHFREQLECIRNTYTISRKRVINFLQYFVLDSHFASHGKVRSTFCYNLASKPLMSLQQHKCTAHSQRKYCERQHKLAVSSKIYFLTSEHQTILNFSMCTHINWKPR